MTLGDSTLTTMLSAVDTMTTVTEGPSQEDWDALKLIAVSLPERASPSTHSRSLVLYVHFSPINNDLSMDPLL